MIEVDVLELKNHIDKLNFLIDKYEEVYLNMFNQLKEACINWQDGNSLNFDDKIYLEKEEAELLIQTLKDKKNIYTQIYNSYIDIGKKIKCNLDSRESLLLEFDRRIQSVNDILNEFQNIDNSFYYVEYQNIINQRNRVIQIKANLARIKNNVSNLFNKIIEIEQDIQEEIKKIEEIKINDFNFLLN